jgi:hypothetical protein
MKDEIEQLLRGESVTNGVPVQAAETGITDKVES